MRFSAGNRHISELIGAIVLAVSVALPWQVRANVESIDSQAEELLKAAVTYLAGQKQFSVDVNANYDVVQGSGQKIEFGEKRSITIARPDRLRVEVEESDGVTHMLLFDGTNITVSTPGSNVFAQSPQQGTLDQAVVFYVRDLGMRLPLAVLMLSSAPEELAKRTRSIAYVEKTKILGKPAHHLAGRTDSVDYQAWVADGDHPLLLRMVLTYRAEDGQPQYRAQFSNWNVTPRIQDSNFAFTPSPSTRRIAFLSDLLRSGDIPATEPVNADQSATSKGGANASVDTPTGGRK